MSQQPSEALTAEFDLQNRIVAAAVTLITLVVYVATVSPTVAFWDSGEFIATSVILGVPHPPGAPFYTLIGRLFSILPLSGDIGMRVNLLSVASGTASVLLVYLCVVRMLAAWMDGRILTDRIAIFTGGAVAALSVAFSFSFWSNATEAEVYALSMLITLLAYWLALRWDAKHNERTSDRLLLFVFYLFGLGAGVHLQCLLTLPGILILVFTDLMKDRPRSIQITAATFLTGFPMLSIVLPMPVTGLVGVATLVALISLRPAWKNPMFWLIGVVLAALGYSTYVALAVRSGLDPGIDMNNPESWANFKAFLSREQYGVHSTFPRRGDFWSYQINIHIRYLLEEFPFVGPITATFRRAVNSMTGAEKIIHYSPIPFLVGLVGMAYHLRRDWRRFASLLAMFLLMGVGLVIYLNMPDPEPREREYIFVGAYTFFGFWIGMGAAAFVRSFGRSVSGAAVAVVVSLMLPAGILAMNWHTHDRSDNYAAHDYAYNLLASCEPNAILFTNGDNDTYPLWYLQFVEGVRTDVRVTNLSLIKTAWYIKQLRDLEPKVPISYSNAYIDLEFGPKIWEEPKSIEIAGLKLKANEVPVAKYLLEGGQGRRVSVVEAHTLIIWHIIQETDWKRPIYFAVTVPESNQAGMANNLQMEGMVRKLVTTNGRGQFNLEATAANLTEKYHYRALRDTTVYKDPVATRLLSNYLIIYDAMLRALLQTQQYDRAYEALLFAEDSIPPGGLPGAEGSWQGLSRRYWELAAAYKLAGQMDRSNDCVDHFIQTYPGLDADYKPTLMGKLDSLIEANTN
jgi:hypothetical protein